MASFSIRNNISALINILVFGGIALYLLQPLAWNVSLPEVFWIRQGILFVLWVTLFFVNSKILVPRFLFASKTGSFSVLLLALIAAVLLIARVAEDWLGFYPELGKAFHSKKKAGGWDGPLIEMFSLFLTIMVAGISTSIVTVRKWYEDAQLRLQMEQESIKSELAALKAQINPHFFFNTLHNIYALIMTDVGKAGEAVYTLSHMMRYVLYETKNDSAWLSQEINFIEDYLKLMALRIGEQVEVSFTKQVPEGDRKIAPMLFLPFIENAFKHGVSPTEPSFISISVNSSENKVSLEVRNSLFPEQKESYLESNGIGLSNTRRRLELLYSGRYQLTIEADRSMKEYRVFLTIENK
jgi:two-component system, LytTR family, sensor kinase